MPAAWSLVFALGLASPQDSEIPPGAGTRFIDPLVLDVWGESRSWEQPNPGPFFDVDVSQTRPWYVLDTAAEALAPYRMDPYGMDPGMREMMYLASDEFLGLLPPQTSTRTGLAGANMLGPWGLPTSMAGWSLQQGPPGVGGPIPTREATGAQEQPGSRAASGLPDLFPSTGPAGTGPSIGPANASGIPLEFLLSGGGSSLAGLLAPAALGKKGITREEAEGIIGQFQSVRYRPSGVPVAPPVPEPEPGSGDPALADPSTPGTGEPAPEDPTADTEPAPADPGVRMQLQAAFLALDTNQDDQVTLAEAEAGSSLPLNLFLQLDADKDQAVSKAEFDAQIDAIAAARRKPSRQKPTPPPAAEVPANAVEDFFLLDKDQDGAVSMAEYSAANLPPTFFLRLDGDKNKSVDRDEFTARAGQAAAVLGSGKRTGPPVATEPALPEAEARALFQTLDQDQDGEVTFEEFAAVQSLPISFFTHVDRNQDERITESELVSARAPVGRSGGRSGSAGADGQLDDEQIDQVLTQLPSSILRRMFTSLDLNHDEVVSHDEFTQSALLPPEVFRRFDVDQDGVIQKAEFTAVVEGFSPDR